MFSESWVIYGIAAMASMIRCPRVVSIRVRLYRFSRRLTFGSSRRIFASSFRSVRVFASLGPVILVLASRGVVAGVLSVVPVSVSVPEPAFVLRRLVRVGVVGVVVAVAVAVPVVVSLSSIVGCSVFWLASPVGGRGLRARSAVFKVDGLGSGAALLAPGVGFLDVVRESFFWLVRRLFFAALARLPGVFARRSGVASRFLRWLAGFCYFLDPAARMSCWNAVAVGKRTPRPAEELARVLRIWGPETG